MSEKEIKTKKELLEVLKKIPIKNTEQKKAIACSLIGHSSIQTACWGYYNCGRCGQQLGDRVGSTYDTRDIVVIGHNCPTCRKNYKKCTWKDKYLVPNPFTKKKRVTKK